MLNLDPPILLRFSADEIVHVQVAGDRTRSTASRPRPASTPARKSPSPSVSATARRALTTAIPGCRPAARMRPGPQVFLQIKDPTSKYQNMPKLEHKVFARDIVYNNAGQPA